jgi:hypothetical protein
MATMAVVYAVGSYSLGGATMAQGGSAGAAKNVVLVHGAFVDDSSWSKIVPLLKAKGFRVTTAGNLCLAKIASVALVGTTFRGNRPGISAEARRAPHAPFVVSQGIVLLLFVVLTIVAAVRFRGGGRPRV